MDRSNAPPISFTSSSFLKLPKAAHLRISLSNSIWITFLHSQLLKWRSPASPCSRLPGGKRPRTMFTFLFLHLPLHIFLFEIFLSRRQMHPLSLFQFAQSVFQSNCLLHSSRRYAARYALRTELRTDHDISRSYWPSLRGVHTVHSVRGASFFHHFG